MRSVGFFLVLAVAPYHAFGQPVEHPEPEPTTQAAAPLELAILIQGTAELDPLLVRGAIAADLGVQVSEAPGAALGSLAISIVQQSVRIEYRPISGASVERTVALPASRDDRTRLISFIATNLVRDQASEILAGLPALPPPAEPAPVATDTPTVVVPPITPTTPAVVRKPATSYFPMSLGLVPPLAVDRVAGSNVVVGVGVHAVAGASDGSQYASISGAIDTKHQFASGVQIAGALAIAGRVEHGLQIGGAAVVSRGRTDGGQIGGAAAMTYGDMHGIQIAGAAAYSGGNTYGVQLAGAASVAKRMRGLQISGAASVTNELYGAQISGGVNIAGEARGLQIGAINVAKRMRGVQIGAINVSDDGDDVVPIGVINYSKNGPLAVDAWVDSSRVTAVGFRHGTRYVHNLWTIGWSPDHDHMMVGAGLGVHSSVAAGSMALGFDVDALYWMTDVVDGDPNKHLSQLRASVTVPLGAVDLFAGAAANVHVANEEDMAASEDFHPVMARRFTSDGGTQVTTWPTVFAGARLRIR